MLKYEWKSFSPDEGRNSKWFPLFSGYAQQTCSPPVESCIVYVHVSLTMEHIKAPAVNGLLSSCMEYVCAVIYHLLRLTN